MLQSMPKSEFLARLKARIKHNRQEVERLYLSLERQERSWQPKRTEWSVDQCFQHLILSFEAFAPRTAEALNTPEPAGSDGMFQHTWFARKTMGMQFDPKTKGRTLKKFNPPAAYSEDVLARFLAQQACLLDMVEQAETADLQSKRWIIKGFPLRYSLGDYLHFFVLHDELHLDQARRVLVARREWLENGMVLAAVPAGQ